MFVKRCVRTFLNTRTHLNLINCPKINPSIFLNKALCHNESTSILPNSRSTELSLINFTNYLLENNNFKHPVSDILNLNFTPDTHESLKLLNRLKETPEDENLREETLRTLNSELNKFSVEDVLKAIVLASRCSKSDKKFVEDFTMALDSELKSRKLQLNESLEIFFVLSRSLYLGRSLKKFYFYAKSNRLLMKLNKLQPLQVVHLFYHIRTLSKEDERVYKFPMLMYFSENLGQFNAQEIAIILAGLIRAEACRCNIKLVKTITNKFHSEIETIDSLSLFYILKFLLKSSSVKFHDVILNFQEKISEHASKFNSRTLTMSLFCGYPYTLSPSLWDSVMKQLKPQIKLLQLTDIERIARITTVFNVNDEEFVKLAVEAVEERQNLDKNIPHIVYFCKHLVVHRIYSKKLLDIIFSKSFVTDMISRKSLKEVNDWIFINNSLKLEKPEYQCTSLDDFLQRRLKQRLFAYMPFDKPVLNFAQMRSFLCKLLIEYYGKDKVAVMHLLPHFDKGVVMKFNENLEALPVAEIEEKKSHDALIKPLDDNIWLGINILLTNSEKLNQIQETYKRQLIALGYEPVLIPSHQVYRAGIGSNEIQRTAIVNIINSEVEKNLKKKAKAKV